VLTLVACREQKAPEVRKSPLETAIARELTAKLATPVTATCDIVAIVAQCEAVLQDGLKLPIEVHAEGGEWAWQVPGRVLETAPIVAYLDALLADLKLGQTAYCGARLAHVAPGDRLGCMLSGGGMAFVEFGSDGAASLELDIDPASGSARGELVTPEREAELTAISKALELLEGESDGEEELVRDGGVPQP
jgi:hypothetical protein